MISVRSRTVLFCLVLVGCSRVVPGDAERQQHVVGPGGPIQPAQLDQLLTPSSSLSVAPGVPLIEYDLQSALFVGADPAECHGAVGFGHFPLFPRDYTGREARTQVDSSQNQHQLLEVSATYPSDFDAAGFLESIRKTVTACQHPVTAWGDDQRKATVIPAPLTPDPSGIAHWSTSLAGDRWVCDFSVLALANVVSEIVTCSPDRSIDSQAIAANRLKKIDQLLNSTA